MRTWRDIDNPNRQRDRTFAENLSTFKRKLSLDACHLEEVLSICFIIVQ